MTIHIRPLVLVIPFIDTALQHVVATKKKTDGTAEKYWKFPSGQQKATEESPRASAQRILQERTGMSQPETDFVLRHVLCEKGYPPRYIFHVVIAATELCWMRPCGSAQIATHCLKTLLENGEISNRTAKKLLYSSQLLERP